MPTTMSSHSSRVLQVQAGPSVDYPNPVTRSLLGNYSDWGLPVSHRASTTLQKECTPSNNNTGASSKVVEVVPSLIPILPTSEITLRGVDDFTVKLTPIGHSAKEFAMKALQGKTVTNVTQPARVVEMGTYFTTAGMQKGDIPILYMPQLDTYEFVTQDALERRRVQTKDDTAEGHTSSKKDNRPRLCVIRGQGVALSEGTVSDDTTSTVAAANISSSAGHIHPDSTISTPGGTQADQSEPSFMPETSSKKSSSKHQGKHAVVDTKGASGAKKSTSTDAPEQKKANTTAVGKATTLKKAPEATSEKRSATPSNDQDEKRRRVTKDCDSGSEDKEPVEGTKRGSGAGKLKKLVVDLIGGEDIEIEEEYVALIKSGNEVRACGHYSWPIVSLLTDRPEDICLFGWKLLQAMHAQSPFEDVWFKTSGIYGKVVKSFESCKVHAHLEQLLRVVKKMVGLETFVKVDGGVSALVGAMHRIPFDAIDNRKVDNIVYCVYFVRHFMKISETATGEIIRANGRSIISQALEFFKDNKQLQRSGNEVAKKLSDYAFEQLEREGDHGVEDDV